MAAPVHRKVKSVPVTGTILALVVYLLAQAGYKPDPALLVLVGAVITAVVAYFVPAAPAA